MELTRSEALRAYARMMNTLNVTPLESLLADDFTYESQHVFSALESKQAFLDYKACLGEDNDSLVESMQSECKAGDAVATKHPAYFCDFNYAVAYNDYNSAFCIYSGKQKPERTEK